MLNNIYGNFSLIKFKYNFLHSRIEMLLKLYICSVKYRVTYFINR